MRIALSLPILALLAGCKTPPPSWQPLTVRDRFEVSYHGEVRPGPMQFEIEPDAEELPPAELEAGEVERQVQIDVQLMLMKRTVAARLLGSPGTAEASNVFGGGHLPAAEARDQLREMVAAKIVDVINASKLLCRDGGSARVMTVSQRAFVKGFDIQAVPDAYIAEPVIEVAHSGAVLELRPVLVGDTEVQLDLSLRVADLQLPVPIVNTPLAGGPPVTLEVPITCSQEVTATTTTGDDDILFLCGLQVPGEDSVLIAFVDVTRIDAPATP